MAETLVRPFGQSEESIPAVGAGNRTRVGYCKGIVFVCMRNEGKDMFVVSFRGFFRRFPEGSRRCSDDVPKVFRRFPDDVPTISRRCSEDFRRCSDDFRRCSEGCQRGCGKAALIRGNAERVLGRRRSFGAFGDAFCLIG